MREREREKGEEGRKQSVNESSALVIDWQKSGDQRERRAHGVVTLDTDQLTRFTFHLEILASRVVSEPERLPPRNFLPQFGPLSLSLSLSFALWDLTLDDRAWPQQTRKRGIEVTAAGWSVMLRRHGTSRTPKCSRSCSLCTRYRGNWGGGGWLHRREGGRRVVDRSCRRATAMRDDRSRSRWRWRPMNQVRWKREKKENRVSESFETKGCRPRVVLRSQSPIQPQARGTLFALTLSQPLSSKHTSFQPLSSLPSPTLSLSLSPCVRLFLSFTLFHFVRRGGKQAGSRRLPPPPPSPAPFFRFPRPTRARAHTHTHTCDRASTHVLHALVSHPHGRILGEGSRESRLSLSLSLARAVWTGCSRPIWRITGLRATRWPPLLPRSSTVLATLTLMRGAATPT